MNRQEKLIAEIHAEFDTAQDRLLKEAQIILSKTIETGQTAVESVGERLKRAGFINTPTAKKADVIKEKKSEEKKKVVETKEQAELIQYYQNAYPFLKFLTEAELDRICKKYNLIYAPSDRYIEEVPEKNLTDIENAQPLVSGDHFKSFISVTITEFYSGSGDLKKWLNGRSVPYPEDGYIHSDGSPSDSTLKRAIKDMGYTGSFTAWTYREATTTKVKKSGLFIAAPEAHFNTVGLKKKGLGLFEVFETKVKDPIVFRYVRGGIQVLTKWGLEANDPDLVVPKLN